MCPQECCVGNKDYNLGAIVARRLHNNGISGDLFGGIYATHVANYLGIPPREGDRELTPAYLDYDAMVSHHFLAIHYFALFIGRCINGKDEACHMCVPNLCVLKSAVLGNKDYNLGAIVAHRLHNNGISGDLFGRIYATRVANNLGISP